MPFDVDENNWTCITPQMITNVSPESKRRHGQINWTDFWWWSILLLLVLRVIDKSIRFYQLHLKRLLFDFAMLRVAQYFQYFGTKVSNQILILGMYFSLNGMSTKKIIYVNSIKMFSYSQVRKSISTGNNGQLDVKVNFITTCHKWLCLKRFWLVCHDLVS